MASNILLILLAILVISGCETPVEEPESSKLLPEGFEMEQLFEPGKHEMVNIP